MKKLIMLLLFACFAMAINASPPVYPPGEKQSIDHIITVKWPVSLNQITIAEAPEVLTIYSIMDYNLEIIQTKFILVEAQVVFINIVNCKIPLVIISRQWKVNNFE